MVVPDMGEDGGGVENPEDWHLGQIYATRGGTYVNCAAK